MEGAMHVASENSFDVVSEFDAQEMLNAVDQAKREISSRFDLKDTGTEVELDGKCSEIVVTTTDETRVRNVIDILESKMSKRGLSIRILDPQKVETALGGKVRQVFKLKKGIPQDLAKKIVSRIKEGKFKVQASIQGEQVRVSGKDRDTLQEVISVLTEESTAWGTPLQYTNYR